jgi:hypothetical protein
MLDFLTKEALMSDIMHLIVVSILVSFPLYVLVES